MVLHNILFDLFKVELVHGNQFPQSASPILVWVQFYSADLECIISIVLPCDLVPPIQFNQNSMEICYNDYNALNVLVFLTLWQILSIRERGCDSVTLLMQDGYQWNQYTRIWTGLSWNPIYTKDPQTFELCIQLCHWWTVNNYEEQCLMFEISTIINCEHIVLHSFVLCIFS